MCTRDKEFTIRGIEDCLARGFDRTGFFEVDTGEQKNWTIQLTDTTRPCAARALTEDHPDMMRRMRRVKILATLGPASADRGDDRASCSRPAPTSSAST